MTATPATNPSQDGSPVVIANTSTYDAFPGVDTLANGSTLLAVYMQATDHATTQDGHLRKRTSTDAGATWSAATTILNDAVLDLRDPCVYRIRSGAYAGRIIVSYFTWDGTAGSGTVAKVIYSDDDSATWSSPITVTTSFTAWSAVTAPVVEAANGDLLLPIYGRDTSDARDSSRVSKSTDGGATWSHLAEIADGVALGRDMNEPFMCRLDNNHLLTMIRSDHPTDTYYNEIHASTSTDHGATWPTPTGKIGGSGRPAIIQRSDGIVVCMFRQNGTQDTRFRASNDRGFWWSQADADFTGGSLLRYEYGQWVTLSGGQIGCVYSLEASGTDSDLSFSKITGGS